MAETIVRRRLWRIQGSVPPDMKRCPDCQEAKPFDAFGSQKRTADSLSVYCRACRSKQSKRRYHKNPAAAAAQARRQNYGLTVTEFASLLCEQAGRCRVCDDPLGGGRNQMHVDHCHSTGRVRGLLCRGCNHAIGHAKESPERLRLMAAYLDYHMALLAA